MPDVQITIRQMLDTVRAEIKQLAERLEVLEMRENTLLEWLSEEEPAQQVLLSENGRNGATRLSTFLQTALSDGKYHRTDELAALADKEGLIGPKKSAKRVINFTMQGLHKHNLVKKNPADGSWGRNPDGSWGRK